MTFTLPRPPANDDELWMVIKALFGVELPRVSVCAEHQSPFEAVAHAYFSKPPNFAVWYASRGSGKSLALAVLGLTKAFVRDIDVTILGGSMTQSLNVREHMRKLMAFRNAPAYAVAKDQATLIQMGTGKKIVPLPASMTTVRGPHPPLQLLDECLEASTQIDTPYGAQRIDSVNPGDTVWSWTGTERVASTVLASRQTGVRPTLKIRLENGLQVVCTGNHPVMTEFGWKAADAIQPGDRVLTVPPAVDRTRSEKDRHVHGVSPEDNDRKQGRLHVQGLRWSVFRDRAQRAWALPRVQSEGQIGQGDQVRRLRHQDLPALAALPSVLAVLPFIGRHDQTDGRGPSDCAQDQGASQQGRAADGGAPGLVRTGLRTVGALRQMDSGLRTEGSQGSDRGTRQLLARQTVSGSAGSAQEGCSDGGRVHSGLRKDGSDAVLVEVSSVRSGPTVPVFNLTVAGQHTYIAGGIVVHNCDEMEKEIYDASMGQAMEQINTFGEVIDEYIVASSTWQNPEGTFTDIIEDARNKGMPIFTWCIAKDSMVLTDRGEVPIQSVTTADQVMTRAGWKPVQHVTKMGTKPTVAVELSNGRILWATADHLVASGGEWIAVGDLVPGSLVVAPAGLTSAIGPLSSPNVDVARVGHVVPASALSGTLTVFPGPSDVFSMSDKFLMPQIHTDGPPAQVVGLEAVGDGANQPEPDGLVGVVAAPIGTSSDAVVTAHGVRPVDALVGIDQELAPGDRLPLHVVQTTPSAVLDVYDIGVYDEHEFTVEGIIVHNCWRELLQPNGWMSHRFIETKRKTVSAQMWHTEYELNEPSSGSRAIDLDKVEAYFQDYPTPVKQVHDGNGDHDEYTWERPLAHGSYAVGADWAKEQDKTVIVVVRYDIKPHRIVKLIRINRRPWPMMIDMFNTTTQDYHANAIHDGTGIGNVVNDYVDYSETTRKFVMVGRERTQMLLDYITAFEHGHYRLPLIPANVDHLGVPVNPLHRAHRAVTVADVYAPGKWNSHLPDDIAAMALVHRALTTLPQPTTQDSGVGYSNEPREADKQFHVKPEQDIVQTDGLVTVVDERYSSDSQYLVASSDGSDTWSAMTV